MNKERFEELVVQAVEALPEEFQARLENVDVVVEDSPTRRQLGRLKQGMTLLGLYEGVPLTERHTSYGMVAPDKITIFQETIEAECNGDEIKIREEIQKVVHHEIAHHFGIGDARLDQIERGK